MSAVALGFVGLEGCAARVPSPELVARAAEARRELVHRAYSVLDVDVDGDGVDETVVATRTDLGFRVELFALVQDETSTRWQSVCSATPVSGEVLLPLRWLDLAGGRRHLAMVTRSEDPDELMETLQLVDLADKCRVSFEQRLRLAKAGAPLVLPDGFEGGVRLATDGRSLELIDRPRYVTLEGAEGEVRLLAGVRRRVLEQKADTMVLVERDGSLLSPAAMHVFFRAENEPAEYELPELVDGDGTTAFALRPGAAGTLGLVTPTPMVLLEAHYGCRDEAGGELELSRAPDGGLVLGGAPTEGLHPVAHGRRQGSAAEGWKALWLVSASGESLDVVLGASPTSRCLRELRGWRSRDGF